MSGPWDTEDDTDPGTGTMQLFAIGHAFGAPLAEPDLRDTPDRHVIISPSLVEVSVAEVIALASRPPVELDDAVVVDLLDIGLADGLPAALTDFEGEEIRFTPPWVAEMRRKR